MADPFGLVDLATVGRARGAAHRAPPRRRRSRRSPTRPATTRRPASASPTPWAAPARSSTRCAPTSSATTCAASTGRRSARHDELLVRQNELPWQGRTTVLLDVRGGRPPRRLARGGRVGRGQHRDRHRPPPGPRPARHHRRAPTPTSRRAPTTSHALLEHLAVVPAVADGRPPPHRSSCSAGAPAAARSSSSWPRCPPRTCGPLARLRARYGSVTVVHLDRSAWDPSAPVGPAARRRRAPRHPRRARSPTAWNALRPRGVRGGRPGGRGDERADERPAARPRPPRWRSPLVTLAAVARHAAACSPDGGWLRAAGRQRRRRPRDRRRAAPPRRVRSALAALVMAVGRRASSITWTCVLVHHHASASPPATRSTAHPRTTSTRPGTLYQDVVAPAPARTGFVVASAAGPLGASPTWPTGPPSACGCPFEATLPPARCSCSPRCSARTAGRAWAVALYAAALLGFLLLHRLARQDGHQPLGGRAPRRRAPVAARPPASALGRAWPSWPGTVHRPALPGADAPGVLDPRDLDGDDDAAGHDQPAGRHPLPARRPVQRRGVHGALDRARLLAAHLARAVRRPDLVLERQLRQGRRRPARRRSRPRSPRRAVDQHVHHRGARRDLAARAPTSRGRSPARTSTSATTRTRPRSSSTATSRPATASTYQVTSASPRLTPADLDRHGRRGPRRHPRRGTPAARRLQPASVARPGRRAHRRRQPRPTSRRGPSRTTCARSPTTSTVPAGPQRRRPRAVPVRDASAGTASSSPAPSPPWPAPSACPPRVAVGFTPGEADPAEPDAVPRARRARPRLARGVLRRRRLGGLRADPGPGHARRRSPTPACRSSRPRPVGPDGVAAPPTATTAGPARRPTARRPRCRDRRRGTDTGTDAGRGRRTRQDDDSVLERYVVDPARRVLPVGARRRRCSTLRRPCRPALAAHRRRRRTPGRRTPSQRIALGLGRGGGGRRAGRLPRAAERHLRRAGRRAWPTLLPDGGRAAPAPWPAPARPPTTRPTAPDDAEVAAADRAPPADDRAPRPGPPRPVGAGCAAGSTPARRCGPGAGHARPGPAPHHRRVADRRARAPSDELVGVGAGEPSRPGDRLAERPTTPRRRGGSARASGPGRRRGRRAGRRPSSTG